MKRLLFLLVIVLAAPSFADTPPANEKNFGNETKTGTLCSNQAATSTGCTIVGGTIKPGTTTLVPVFDGRGFKSIALYSNQSTASTYSCNAHSSDNGYDGDSGVGQVRSTTPLSNTQELIILDGAIAFVWIECPTIADNQVTVTFVAIR
jgi:hypothetical protein